METNCVSNTVKKLNQRRARRSWIVNFLTDLYREINGKYHTQIFESKNWFQRATKGYAEYDWWEYASNNSERAVKLLTILKEKSSALPHGIIKCNWIGEEVHYEESKAKWKSMLDDMIFYHQCVAGMYEEVDGKYGEYGVTKEVASEIDNLEKRKQFRRGKYYYYKYYQALWD